MLRKSFLNASFILSALVLGLTADSCRTKDKQLTPVTPTPRTHGKLTIKFVNDIDGHSIIFDTLAYTNATGNKYSVGLLKYYVSNFTLIKQDSSKTNFGNYKLINAADTSTCHFTLDSVVNGDYTAIRFYLGVDSAHNHTGDQTGDLDPRNAMIWTWNTGYMFMKHEGLFVPTTGGTSILAYHYGTDMALATVDIPLSAFSVLNNDRTITIRFNLNTLYSTPVQVDFNNNNIHESTSFDDVTWLNSLKRNFPSAFILSSVE